MRKTGFIVAVLVLAGCQPPGPTPRISADVADRAALAVAGSPDAKVIGTRLSSFGVEAPRSGVADAATVVWAVSLSGRFRPGSCGPAPIPPATPGPCPSPQNTQLVLIDATTGAFIMGRIPDPGASAAP